MSELWDEVADAVSEAISDGEGRASAGYLERHFKKAGLTVSRMSEPLAWDAATNRYYQPVEQRAAEIYAAFPYDGPGTKPEWVPNGNAAMQDEARKHARLELHAFFHRPR